MNTDKICVVTCYRQPDYVRAVVIRNAIEGASSGLIVVKNKHTNLIRYIEVTARLLYVTIKHRPDVYLITFRGYEILPFVRLIAIKKAIIFDEFVNPIEWLIYEHRKISKSSFLAKLINKVYAVVVSGVDIILSDTASHARFSSQITGMPITKYRVLPVGTDEHVFKKSDIVINDKSKEFRVLFYGSMLPLHGLGLILDVATELSSNSRIKFIIIGGGTETRVQVYAAKNNGANIEYKEWVNYKNLPDYISRSQLCLGGPFGNTVQSEMVVTGKTYQFIASGKATVIGKGIDEMGFKDKVNCILVKQGSTESLKDAINWAFENQEELMQIGEKARKLYEAKYSKDVLVQRMQKVIAELASS